MTEIRNLRSVLFVCTANICRSPMAVGLFRDMTRRESDLWQIESAGVYARPGFQAAEYTLQVLERRGINLSEHRSRPISPDLVKNFQLILTMERNHKEALQAAFPEFSKKIKLFTEIIGERSDIVDPIGKPLLEYEDTAREMESILLRGYANISQLTGVRENG